jgi:hypothetical protein
MRAVIKALFLATVLFFPESAQCQDSASPVHVQLSAVFSDFRFERGPDSNWRPSTAIGLRVIVRDRFFGDFHFGQPIASEGPVFCPGQPSCPPELTEQDDKTNWWFSVLSGGLGFRFPGGKWIPSIGIGGGRLKTEDEKLWSWVGTGGVERVLSKRLTMLFEYRGYRVDWPTEGFSWNHEVGIGLTWSF